MNYTARIDRLGWFFVVLGLAIVGFAGYRMLLQKEDLSHRIYMDSPMQGVFENLADQLIFAPDGDGVVIDIDRLRTEISSPGLRQFILDRRRFLSFEDGHLIIQPEALTVQNRRILQRLMGGRRGRILDCKGQPLAQSLSNEKGGFTRSYSLGSAGFSLIGVAHPVYGVKGLEAALDSYLQGATQEGPVKKMLRFFTGSSALCDVVLTIDADLQNDAFKALGGKTGAVALMEVATGDILVAASTPSFDPSTPPGELWDTEAGKGRNGAFFNRALSCRYPPGSTFKLVTASAWMESPNFDPNLRVMCKGRHPKFHIGEYKGKRHGWMNLSNAITHSCNVYFSELGVQLGPQLADMTQRFGFNEKWHLSGLKEDLSLILPSRSFRGHATVAQGGVWEAIDYTRNPKLVAQAAIGQNLIEATPLQMAMVAAAIGNDGQLMNPRLVKRIQYVEADGSSRGSWITDQTIEVQPLRQACSKQTARELIGMMATVMQKGTGHRLKKIFFHNGEYHSGNRLPEGATNVLAGKTGTAQSGRGRNDHAWFLGLAPVDYPKFAIAVMVEHGGLGARTAGPIAVNVMQAALNIENSKEGKQ